MDYNEFDIWEQLELAKVEVEAWPDWKREAVETYLHQPYPQIFYGWGQ